jgi:GrpB-like predicted nucleotidyltransferase (UPF0157 family)
VSARDDGPDYLIPAESGPVLALADPDPRWADVYESEASSIRAALGPVAVEVHHAGSTSVPGLAAKPIIDIVLLVEDPDDEASYVRALESVGYAFHVRERGWHRHRLFKKGTPHHVAHDPAARVPKVNLHLFGVDGDEPRRMLLFRDWLRSHPEDRDRYEQTKRRLLERSWTRAQEYADAKSAVVAEIMERAHHGGRPGYDATMSTPELNADFVQQVLASASRLLADPDTPPDVTDVQIADDTGLELPTVRAVLLAEEGKRITMQRSEAEDPWRVGRVNDQL